LFGTGDKYRMLPKGDILNNFETGDNYKFFVTGDIYQLLAQCIVTKYLANEILITV
jgi:hypothetical protein